MKLCKLCRQELHELKFRGDDSRILVCKNVFCSLYRTPLGRIGYEKPPPAEEHVKDDSSADSGNGRKTKPISAAKISKKRYARNRRAEASFLASTKGPAAPRESLADGAVSRPKPQKRKNGGTKK